MLVYLNLDDSLCLFAFCSDMVQRLKVRRALQEVLHQSQLQGNLVWGVHDAANELAV